MHTTFIAVANKIGEVFGIPSLTDANAQNNCFEYLQNASEVAKQKIIDMGGDPDTPVDYTKASSDGKPPGEDEVSLLKNQRLIVDQILNLIETSAGSFAGAKSTKFWMYWDKVKQDAIRIMEGNDISQDLILNKLDELEVGRNI